MCGKGEGKTESIQGSEAQLWQQWAVSSQGNTTLVCPSISKGRASHMESTRLWVMER